MKKEDVKKIVETMKSDSKFKKELISEIMTDGAFIDELTKAVFTQPAVSVGLNTSGTISEFFRREGEAEG